MESNSEKSLSEHLQAGGPSRKHKVLRRRNRVWKFGRIVTAFVVVVGLATLMAGAGLYYLLQGEASKDSVLHDRLEASIREALGKDYDVELGPTNLAFGKAGLLSISSRDLLIFKTSDQSPVASLGNINVGTNLFDTIRGKTTFGRIIVEDVHMDASFGGGGNGVPLPSHIEPALEQLGNGLASLSRSISDGVFNGLVLRNVELVRAKLGTREETKLLIPQLDLLPGRAGRIDLAARMRLGERQMDLVAQYRPARTAGHQLVFNLSGFDVGAWLPSPDAGRVAVGSDAIITFTGNFPFSEENKPLQPLLTLESDRSNLNIAGSVAPLTGARLNLRLLPQSNSIVIERSIFQLGQLSSTLVGEVVPIDEQAGFLGNLAFNLGSEQSRYIATREGEPVIPFSIQTSGIIDQKAMVIEVREGELLAGEGSLRANGTVGIASVSPPLKLEAETQGISLIALKQLWPMTMGPKARTWAHKHLYDGWVKSGRVVTDIPEGILGYIQDGKRFKPEHIEVDLEIEDGVFQPFGQMPDVKNANAVLKIKGMELQAKIGSAAAIASNGGAVQINNVDFKLDDFADVPAQATASVKLTGGAKTLATIAQTKPFSVMDQLEATPDQVSGKATAQINISLPLGAKIETSDLKWKALVSLNDFSTTKKFADRSLEKADVKIDVVPGRAVIAGTGVLDGVPAKFDVTEPIGKNSKVQAKRIVTVKLDEAGMKKAGINAGNVLTGSISARIEQTGNASPKQIVELKQASLALPWIAWEKGVGVPAKAEFTSSQKNGVTFLENLKLSGPGFRATGSLGFDDRGLVSARLKDVALNDADSFAVSIDRKSDVFHIRVDGQSIDARGLINTVIHEGDFKEGQGATSVELTANLGRILGFEGRQVRNAIVRYSTRKGFIQLMDIKGVADNGEVMSVYSVTEGNKNTFDIRSDNAGHSLGFVNIYKKMQGGRMRARLSRVGLGAYSGNVRLEKFTLIDEPKLASLVSTTKRAVSDERGRVAIEKIERIEDDKARFQLAEARIEKGDKYLRAEDGFMRGAQIGFTFGGTVYDARDRMKISGTFMPAFAISQVVSSIPIIGQIFGGRDNGLIGITYRLRGPVKGPTLDINPMSIVAPGIFNKVFEFK